jgi:hypothetical protein
MSMQHKLTAADAEQFAHIALGHVTREYPHKLDHVMEGPDDVLGPRALHPIFFGSFDWHSCVHGYWLLMRTRRLFGELQSARRVDELLDATFTEEKVAGELAYLDRAYTGGFERPYGWAWLLALHAEAACHDTQWSRNLEPLALAFAERFRNYLPRLTYPVRTGAHYNTAFSLILALEWARDRDSDLAATIRERAITYYGDDRACAGWEPGGDDFLSPALTEALLMRRVLEPADFRPWFAGFLPELPHGRPASLVTPAFVSDRSDGKIAHLDGVNLSRAWCWRGLAGALEPEFARLAEATADIHLEASLSHVVGDYMGEHWLATFALLALQPLAKEDQ